MIADSISINSIEKGDVNGDIAFFSGHGGRKVADLFPNCVCGEASEYKAYSL